VFRLVIASVRHNTGRYVATLVAIVTGVAFYTATGFVSDRVIDSLEGDVDRQYGNVDVAVVPAETEASAAQAASAQATVSGNVTDDLLALDGIDAGAGVLTGTVAFLGADGRPFADDATGRLWVADDELNPLDLESGRAPRSAGEIAVDRGLAGGHDLEVGQEVTLLTLAGDQPVTIVGLTRFGNNDALDSSGTVSLPEATAFDWLNDGQVEYQSYYLRGSATQDALLAEVRPQVPDGFEAQTGDEFRADQRNQVGSFGRILKQALQGFALLALLVGGFVIYNTFSVIVAQRLRELAVLAAIGATGTQLKRSLRNEGLVLGVVGSLLGVAAGLLLTFALVGVLSVFGVSLPGSGVSVRPANVIGGALLGTFITVFSVTIPARRAARTEPIEAMRDAAVEAPKQSRARAVWTVALCVLGLLGLLAGSGLATVGLAVVALAAGVIVGGPFVATGGARLSRPLMQRFGLEGRLAVDNTIRNPQRTATTANALLIGVFLVTFVAVGGTSVRDFAVGEINKLSSADYLVTSDGGSIDPAFVAKMEKVDHVTTVSPFRRDAVTVDGRPLILSSANVPEIRRIAGIDVENGSLEDLGEGTIALVDDGVRSAEVGSTVTVSDNRGRSVDLRVVALIDPSIDALQVGSLVDPADFDALVGDVAPTVAFLDVDSGAQTETKDAIHALADRRPDITVQEGNALGRLVGSIFDFLIKAVTGLLLMSVVIALIGIVNTMSLSILERRRELGLLRVVGMTDSRVQRMVRLESVLIAMLGTVTGLVLGLVVSLGLITSINRLSQADVSLSLPWVELAGVLVAGTVLGFLAALVPARRSTRLDVLDAIQTT
jgi:putative ABC transport system permease protein